MRRGGAVGGGSDLFDGRAPLLLPGVPRPLTTGNHDSPPANKRDRLMQVALPLDAIDAASRRRWSIRSRPPGTPQHCAANPSPAAGRAVILTQAVDDPSAMPDGGDSGERESGIGWPSFPNRPAAGGQEERSSGRLQPARRINRPRTRRIGASQSGKTNVRIVPLSTGVPVITSAI